MQQNIDAKSDFEAQKFTLKHAHLTSFLRNRNETAEINPRSKIQEGFAWQIRRPRAPLSGNLFCGDCSVG